MIVALAALAVGLLFWVPVLIILLTCEQNPAFRCRFIGHDPLQHPDVLPYCLRCGVSMRYYEVDGWKVREEQYPRGPGFIDSIEGEGAGPGPMPDE